MRRAKAVWEQKTVENIDESNLWRKVKEAMGSARAQAASPPLRAETGADGQCDLRDLASGQAGPAAPSSSSSSGPCRESK